MYKALFPDRATYTIDTISRKNQSVDISYRKPYIFCKWYQPFKCGIISADGRHVDYETKNIAGAGT